MLYKRPSQNSDFRRFVPKPTYDSKSDDFKLDSSDYLIIIPGDVPLIDKNEIDELIDSVTKNNSTLGLITAEVKNPSGYGRIVRNKNNAEKIVEESDASEI